MISPPTQDTKSPTASCIKEGAATGGLVCGTFGSAQPLALPGQDACLATQKLYVHS